MAAAPPLILQWDREHYFLPYTEQDLRETTLAQFKEVCREVTGIPVNDIKLVFSGGIMTDDSSPLDRYGVYVGAKIKVADANPNSPKPIPLSPQEKIEHQSIQKLDHIVQQTSDQLLERMQTYMSNVELYIQQFLHPVDSEVHQVFLSTTGGVEELEEICRTEKGSLDRDYVFITETLMQALLKIDNVVVSEDAENGRQRRKQAVRQLQGWLDQMDRVKDKLSQAERRIKQQQQQQQQSTSPHQGD
ncbi:hypothetical protein EV182_003007 [Spiromyces aspiralis]|uniref:Uncharacterized protein n=1 Tax=Spiromyces aspiralis TaxID=68401 RepID=A0ACC1HTI0_9FUNG|nr:hypothetical protein EV182_003007 [Spiromyces aspiralis]